MAHLKHDNLLTVDPGEAFEAAREQAKDVGRGSEVDMRRILDANVVPGVDGQPVFVPPPETAEAICRAHLEREAEPVAKAYSLDPTLRVITRDEFIPEVVQSEFGYLFALFATPLERCGTCSGLILADPLHFMHQSTYRHQAQRANVALSFSKFDGKVVCDACRQAGRSSFVCALCGAWRRVSDLHESIGHAESADHLCSLCWTNISAKTWFEKVKELTDKHRYDFE